MARFKLEDLMSPLKALEQKFQELVDKGAGPAGGGAAAGQAVATGDMSSLIEINTAMAAELKGQTTLLKQIASNTSGGGGGGDGGIGGRLGKTAEAILLLSGGVVSLGRALRRLGRRSKSINKGIDSIGNLLDKLGTEFEDEARTEKLKEGGEALTVIGDGILRFMKAMAISSLLAIPAAIGAPIVFFIVRMAGRTFSAMGRQAKEIKAGANAIEEIGYGLTQFAIGFGVLMLISLAVIAMPQLALVGVGLLLSMALVFRIIGAGAKQIRKGGRAVAFVGLGLAAFGAGYFIFALAISKSGVSFKSVGIQMLVLVGMLGVFGLAGQIIAKNPLGPQILLYGLAAFAALGLGLLVFSFGYKKFAEATKGMKMMDAVIQGAVLLEVGLVMALMGLAVFASAGSVLLGPVMYGAIGLSLVELSKGLVKFKEAQFTKEDAEDMGAVLTVIKAAFSNGPFETKGGGFGGFLGSIGNAIAAPFETAAVAGSAASMSLIGGALVDLSKGLAKYKAVKFTQTDAEDLAVGITSISAAFANAGGGSEYMLGIKIKPSNTEAGISATKKAGMSLISIASGLKAFMALSKTIPFGKVENNGDGNVTIKKADGSEDTKGDTLAYRLVNGVGMVQQAFAAIGEQNQKPAPGLFGMIGFSQNSVAQGIKATKNAGKSMDSIVKGLRAFMSTAGSIDFGKIEGAGEGNVVIKKADGSDDTSGETLAYMVVNGVGMVQQAFAAIGAESAPAPGLFGMIGFSQNSVNRGIKVTKNAGKRLTEIAKALQKFGDMITSGPPFGDPSNPNGPGKGTITEAVINSMGVVQAGFEAIGKQSKPSKAFFGLAGALGFKENPVKQGIRKVRGAGRQLTQIAKGLKAFADIISSGVKFGDPASPSFGGSNTITAAVVNSMGIVTAGFEAIGKKSKPSKAFFGLGGALGFKENPVKQGIRKVRGAGKQLREIASGLKAFADIMNKGIKFGDPKSPTFGGDDTLTAVVVNSMGIVSAAFEAIGAKSKPSKAFFGLAGALGFKDNPVKQGIKKVKGAGKQLKEIAIGLSEFQKLANSKIKFGDASDPQPGTLAEAVMNSIGFVNAAFAAIGNDGKPEGGGRRGLFSFFFPVRESATQLGIKKVKGAGKQLKDIADGLKGFVELTEKDNLFDDPNTGAQGVLGPAVKKTILFVAEAFAAIGGQSKDSQALGGAAKFFAFKENPVKQGIKKIKGAGTQLKEISDGLLGFVKLTEKKNLFPSEKGPGLLAPAVAAAMTFVADAFAQIGGQSKPSTALFGGAGVIGFNENAVAQGIKKIKGAGTELANIAKGLETFSKIAEPKRGKDPFGPEGHIGKAVVAGVSFVSSAFAIAGGGNVPSEISNNFPILANLYVDPTEIKRGVDAVSGSGEQVKVIAEALKAVMKADPKGMGENLVTAGQNFVKGTGLYSLAFGIPGGTQIPSGLSGVMFGAKNISQGSVSRGLKVMDGAATKIESIGMAFGKIEKVRMFTAGRQLALGMASTAAGINILFGEDDAPEVELTSNGISWGSMGRRKKKGSKTNIQKLNMFADFYTRIGRGASAFSKAARSMNMFARAINKIEIPKAEAMTDFMHVTSTMGNRRRFDVTILKKLAIAIDELKAAVVRNVEATESAPPAGSADPGGEGTASAPGDRPAGTFENLEKLLNSGGGEAGGGGGGGGADMSGALSQLNSTLQRLPAAIANAIEGNRGF